MKTHRYLCPFSAALLFAISKQGVVAADLQEAQKLALVNQHLVALYQENYLSGIDIVQINDGSNILDQLKLKPMEMYFSVMGADKMAQPALLKTNAGYYEFRVNEPEKLKAYLTKIRVKPEYIKKIIDEVASGVKHDSSCTGSRSACLLSASENPRYVIDYYENNIRVFLPSNYFQTVGLENSTYIMRDRLENQLVTSLYANYNHMDNKGVADDSYFLRTQNYLGLGNGYLNVNATANKVDNEINNFEYINDFGRHTFYAGYVSEPIDHSVLEQNSFFAGKKFLGVGIAKTDNLMLSDERDRVVSFYSPASGIMEILRDGAVIFQGFAQPGMNDVPLSLLPKGIYNIEIRLKNGDAILATDRRNVVNLQTNNSMFSYYFRYGDLLTNDVDLSLAESGVNIPFSSYGVNLDLSTYLLDERDPYFSVGVSYRKSDDFTINFKDVYVEDAVKRSLNLVYKSSSIQLTESVGFSKIADKNISYVVGDRDYKRVGLNLNFPLGNQLMGYGSAYYTLDSETNTTSTDYRVGLSMSTRNGIYAGLDYSFGNINESIFLNLNIPFGSKANVNNFTQYNKDKEIDSRALLSYNDNLTDSTRYGLNASVPVINQSGASVDPRVGASLTNYTDKYNATLHGSFSEPFKEIGATLSTTQLINSSGVFYTSREGVKSALVVENDQRDNKVDPNYLGKLTLRDYSTGINSYHNLMDMTPVYFTDYGRQYVKFDVNEDFKSFRGSDLGNNQMVDLFPGKLRKVNIKVVEVSELVVITPQNDEKNILCLGDGCVSTSKIEKGVIKFQVKSGKNFKVKSGRRDCWDGVLNPSTKKAIICAG